MVSGQVAAVTDWALNLTQNTSDRLPGVASGVLPRMYAWT